MSEDKQTVYRGFEVPRKNPNQDLVGAGRADTGLTTLRGARIEEREPDDEEQVEGGWPRSSRTSAGC